MAIRTELHHLLDEVLGDDPRRSLIAVRRLHDDHLPWLEARAVAKAREHGWNWAQIGRLLGRRRQSVRERYRVLAPTSPRGTGAGDQEREWLRMRDGFRRLREFEGDEVAGW